MQENTVYAYQTNGIFYFSGADGIGSGNDLADFLFGASDEFDEFSKAPSNEHQKQYAVFAQDEWKATSRLTLTLGLFGTSTRPLKPILMDIVSASFRERSRRSSPMRPSGLLF